MCVGGAGLGSGGGVAVAVAVAATAGGCNMAGANDGDDGNTSEGAGSELASPGEGLRPSLKAFAMSAAFHFA